MEKTTTTKAEKMIRLLQMHAQDEVEQAQAALSRFTSKLATNPGYAMEDSDRAFTAAASNEAWGRVIHILETVKEDPEAMITSIRKLAAEKVQHTALYPSHSTSQSHNIMSICYAQAWAQVVDFLKVA